MINTIVCPRCGANLVEDVCENLLNTEDGEVTVDTIPAYICQDKCGYMKQIEMLPTAIAQQGDHRLLLLYPDDQGRILDLQDHVIWPPMHYTSLLSRGYWDKYTGNHDIKTLLQHARDSRGEHLEEPNLFEFATSELSQDAFLCWLMTWSPQEYRMLDQSLHEAAIDFISVIFNMLPLPVPTIQSIDIRRQFKSLDILAIVNDKYAILIEDKTYTNDHSNQLIRYREAVKEAYPHLTQLPVYYKIADQSHYLSPESAGYTPLKRKMMLEILERGIKNGVQNTIFVNYYRHLKQLEMQVSSFWTTPVTMWNSFAWQGFYQELQKEIVGNWGYVPNPIGGFWAFWWGSASNQYYYQLEQQRLCVKIVAAEKESRRDLRNHAMKEILEKSERYSLSLQRPSKMGSGKTMTIAERTNYIYKNDDGLVDIKRTIEELKKY